MNNEKAISFRKCSNNIVESYTIKDWVIHKHTTVELIHKICDNFKDIVYINEKKGIVYFFT